MKKIQYTLLLTCSLGLVGCFDSNPLESGSVDRWIDNPTANEIKVSIDGKELIIPAKSGINYTFDYGKHSLSYNNQTINFMAKPAIVSNSGFINPTQSNYILLTTYYTNNQQVYEKMIASKLKNVPIIINGEQTEIELPINVVNDVFIERNKTPWDYSIDEALPDSVTVKGENQYQSQRRKLYREDEFLKTLDIPENEKVSFPYQPKNFADLPKVVMPTISLDSITCKKGREFVDTQVKDWNKFFNSTGKELANVYNQLTSSETFQTKHAILSECSTNGEDKNRTYATEIDKIDETVKPQEQVNLFITQ